jgi:hypothetical protein
MGAAAKLTRGRNEPTRTWALARGVRHAGRSGDVRRARCRLGRIGAGDDKAVEGRAGHLDDERGTLAVDGSEVVDARPPGGCPAR